MIRLCRPQTGQLLWVPAQCPLSDRGLYQENKRPEHDKNGNRYHEKRNKGFLSSEGPRLDGSIRHYRYSVNGVHA